MERTLVILKPDCVQRRLIGRVIQRFEDKGFTISGMKLMRIPRDLAEKHYAVHRDKPFYAGLLKHVTSGPVVLLVLQGSRCIEVVRTLMGQTFGYEASPGTIRGDLGLSRTLNLVHGSDSAESASAEISLYFADDELQDQETAGTEWIQKDDEV
ncbi:MAG: nucleoside-diphosphate kinase [bacterium]|nr:nucleoside-diphosphate kinase [bacterium]